MVGETSIWTPKTLLHRLLEASVVWVGSEYIKRLARGVALLRNSGY